MEATKVSAHEVKARMERGDPLVFIDARNAKAWDESPVKMPGAIRVPADEVDRHLQEIPHNRPIITYCT
ncbi:MAG TPA: rhodanese-like domain-containing protein [Candidatus Tectomicrobia bacterium]|jgi:rhodanese-related sulfurtransferase|nr:rhodanese-like domain-containing protein [Candidatus Tectomicrobia bacterium]